MRRAHPPSRDAAKRIRIVSLDPTNFDIVLYGIGHLYPIKKDCRLLQFRKAVGVSSECGWPEFSVHFNVISPVLRVGQVTGFSV